MAEDLFTKFLARAKPAKSATPKTPKSNVEKFKDALKGQLDNLNKVGTSGFKRANTDWFKENGDGTFQVRFGRPMITFGKDADGKDINYFICNGKAEVVEQFEWTSALADNDPVFAKMIDAAYSTVAKKSEAPVEPAKPKRGRKPKAA